MKILVSAMSAMAETAGPSGRARLLVEHLKASGIGVATCMAEDVNYKPIIGVKNYYLEVPMPLGLPKAIASHIFPIAQKLGSLKRRILEVLKTFYILLEILIINIYQKVFPILEKL